MIEAPIEQCRTLTGLEPVTEARPPDKPVRLGDGSAIPYWKWLEAEAARLRSGGVDCEVMQDGPCVYLARAWRKPDGR